MSFVLTCQRGLRSNRQAAFCVFDFQCQELQTLRVTPRIDFEFLDELFRDGIKQRSVPVDPAKIQIAAAGNNFHFVLVILHQRKVECSATQVIHQNPLLFSQFGEPQPFRAEYVTQGSGDRFVDHVYF